MWTDALLHLPTIEFATSVMPPILLAIVHTPATHSSLALDATVVMRPRWRRHGIEPPLCEPVDS